MRKAFKVGMLLSLACILNACSGVKFNNRADFNRQLSPDMLGRSIITDTEIMKRHLEEIPGYIAVEDGEGNLKTVAPLQVKDFLPKVTAINDKNAFYHSIIDKTAGLQGSYLKLLTLDLKLRMTAEVTIIEAAEAFIPGRQVPWEEIVKWAKANRPTPGEKRYYVQGVLLSNISKVIYQEVSSNATVDGGAAFGIDGKVYATNKNTETAYYAYIGAHLLDVDAIAQNPPITRTGKGKGELGFKPDINKYEVKGKVFKNFEIK